MNGRGVDEQICIKVYNSKSQSLAGRLPSAQMVLENKSFSAWNSIKPNRDGNETQYLRTAGN